MSRTVTEARAFDYLYDPNVTVTSARDFNRSNAAAFKRGVVRVAEAENLFSSLPHHPQARYRAEPPKDLPQNVSTEYDTRVRAATMHATLHPVPSGEGAIMGASRPKFFKRPNVAVLDPLLDRLKLDSGGGEGEGGLDGAAAHAPQAGAGEDWDEEYGTEPDGTAVRSIAVQTAYRDSAAQTDAYTPEYTVPAGTEPALLQLAHLRVGGAPGAALPAGEAEIEAIRVARRRTKVKANLPPVSDEVSLELRKKLLEQLEMDALVERERGMDDLGAARVAAVETALRDREASREFVSEQRVEDLRRRLQAEVDIAHAITQARRVKLLRKLGRQRKAEEAHVDMLTGTGSCLGLAASVPAPKSAPGSPRAATKVPGKGRRATRDIISEYADYGSTVYAPLARDGRFPDKLAPVPRRAGGAAGAAAATLASHAGLVDLSMSLSGRALGGGGGGEGGAAGVTATLSGSQPRAASPGSKSAAAERLKGAADADLERVYSALQGAKRGAPGGAAGEGVPAWRKPKVILDRPPTPCWDDVDETEEEAALDAATVFLQAVFRGRADQLAMLEGVDRRADLLDELRAEVTDAYLLGRGERGTAPPPLAPGEAAAAALAAGLADVTDAVLGALMADSLQGLLAGTDGEEPAGEEEEQDEGGSSAALSLEGSLEAAAAAAVALAPEAAVVESEAPPAHAQAPAEGAAPLVEAAASSPRTGAPAEAPVAVAAAAAAPEVAAPENAAAQPEASSPAKSAPEDEDEGEEEGVGDMPSTLSLSTRASLVLNPEDLPSASEGGSGSAEGGSVGFVSPGEVGGAARPPTRSARPTPLGSSPGGRAASSSNLFGGGLSAEELGGSLVAGGSVDAELARPGSMGGELAGGSLEGGADSVVGGEEGEEGAGALELRASPVRAATAEGSVAEGSLGGDAGEGEVEAAAPVEAAPAEAVEAAAAEAEATPAEAAEEAAPAEATEEAAPAEPAEASPAEAEAAPAEAAEAAPAEEEAAPAEAAEEGTA